MAITVARTQPVRDYHTQQEHYLYKKVAYNTVPSGVLVTVGRIPSGSYIGRTVLSTNTTFNAGTTNVFTVGNTTAATEYVAAVDPVEAAVDVYEFDTSLGKTTADMTVYAKYTQTGTAATQGEAEVWVHYTPAK